MNMTKNGPDGHSAEIRARYIRSMQLSVCHCSQL